MTAPKSDAAAPSCELDGAALAPLKTAASDAGTLLRDVPGLSLWSGGGLSSLPAIHGLADDRLLVRVDGVELPSACPNHMNAALSMIDPAKVANVKVFAGVSPVSAGGDSIGGTVLVDSPAPEFAQGPSTLLKGEAGAFYRSNASAFGANLAALVAGRSLSFSYLGSFSRADDYRASRDFKAPGPAAMGQGWLDGDVVGSSRFRGWNHQIGLAARAGAHLVEVKAFVQDLSFEGFPNQRMDLTGNDSLRVLLHYTGRFGFGTLEASAWTERTRHSMNFGDDKQFWYSGTIPGMPMETEGRNAGAAVKVTVALSSGSTLAAGAEYLRFRLDDWWPPSGGMMAPNTFWNVNDGRRDRLGVYAEWNARWSPRWSTLLGLRSDTVRSDTGPVQGYYDSDMMAQYRSESAAFNAADRARTDQDWDATAIVRFAASPTFSLAAGLARKTRAPNLYERYAWSTGGMAMVMNNLVGDGNGYVGNLDLRPEVASTASLTFDAHDPAREGWSFVLTPFYTAVHDFVDAVRCVSANMNCGAMNQTATTGFVYLRDANQAARLYGLDASGRVVLSRGGAGTFEATLVASLLRGENRTTGGDLYNILPSSGRLALDHHISGWASRVELQAVGAKTRVSAVRNEVPTAGHALVNVRTGYAWKHLRVDAGVENLFDTFHALPLGGAYVGQGMTMSGAGVPWGVPVPGPARSVYVAFVVKT